MMPFSLREGTEEDGLPTRCDQKLENREPGPALHPSPCFSHRIFLYFWKIKRYISPGDSLHSEGRAMLSHQYLLPHSQSRCPLDVGG